MSNRQHNVVWLSPSPTNPPAESSAQLVARAVSDQAVIALKDLEVWAPDLPLDYSMSTEVEGLRRFVHAKGWRSVHLVGFSAGATVAIATALKLGHLVRTLVLIEPAYIGEDDWSPSEAAFRERMSEVSSLPPELHEDAFRRALTPPGEPVPVQAAVPLHVTKRDLVLHRKALRRCGFTSGELVRVTQPTLVVTGGRSHPHFAEASDRLSTVLPDASAETFPERHHFSSPQRNESQRMARLLLRFWGRAQTRSST